jgi:hypothetical protein
MLMRDEDLIEQLRKGLRHLHENPGELWEKLIREGIIDEEGNVLVRIPEPPPKRKAGKAPKSVDGKDQCGSPERGKTGKAGKGDIM